MDIGNIQLTDKEIQAGNINIPVIKGAPGKDGYTPVKGKDYWTTQDKEEIIQEVNQEFNNKLEEKADKAEVETQLDAKVDKEEGKGLSEENFTKEDKQKLENIVPETTKSLQGTSFHIPDSAKAPMKISPRGNIEQETRDGYNDLKNTATSQTVSDVTFTVNKDGSVLVNGTATATINFKLMENFELEDENIYTLLGAGSGSSPTTYGLLINQYYDSASHIESDYGNGAKFTYKIASKSTNSIYIYIKSGATISNVLFKPMLLKGEYTISTAPKYEQYGAMPSLAFPSPVKHVGGSVKSYNTIDLTDKLLSEKNGVKVTFSDDKKVILNGTPTASWTSFTNPNINITDLLEDGETYSLIQTVYDGFCYSQLKNQSGSVIGNSMNSKLSFTVDKTTNTTYYYQVQIGDITKFTGSYNNYEIGFMLIKGTEEKPYLPYGEVGSVYDIANINKNLFDKNKKDMLSSFYKTDGSIGSSSSSWYITNIKVKPNTNYYLSGNNFSNTTACTVLLDKNKKYIKTIGGYSNTHLIATTNDTEYIGLSIPIHSSIKDVDTLMLEEGNTATDYVAHKSENHSLDLTNLPLYSKKDRIYEKDGKWFVHNEYGKELLSGKLHQRIPTSNSSKFLYTINLDNALRMDNNKVLYAGYSNLLKSTTREDIFVNLTPGIAYSSLSSDYFGTGGLFYLDETAEMTLEETKAFIAEKGMYVVYPLATPTETEITDKKVIAQLEELYNTYAYDEVTNISVDNPVLSAELVLDVLYYQKTALGLETKVSYEEYAKLQKRVEELENVILTLGGTI